MKVAVASGKGGTGKTTLSVNLADYISTTNKYSKIVLADLDVEEPNSGLFIKGKTVKFEEKFKSVPEWEKDRCSSCGLCDEVCNFGSVLKIGKSIMILPELCHSCYACSELCPEGALPMKKIRMGELKVQDAEKFTFIESRLDIGQEQAVPLISQSIDFIEKEYAVNDENLLLIMDSPPGTSCPVIEVAKNSDFIILVTEPTPFGLHDLKLAVNTVREIGRNFAVVINRYGIGNNEVEKYCFENGIDIISKLPNMREVAEIYSQGKIIHEFIPAFSFELKKILDYLKNYQENRNS